MKNLTKTIRLLRHQKGWSQEEAAKRLDISIPALSKIETGITDVNLSRIKQLAALFEISVVELLTYNEVTDTAIHQAKICELHQRLRDRDGEIIGLQKKVIELFEVLEERRTITA